LGPLAYSLIIRPT